MSDKRASDNMNLHLGLKVSDRFTALLCDKDGNDVCDYKGYVPEFMPGMHNGDYVILNIDIDTGRIVNWTFPNVDQLQEFIDKTVDEEERK